MTLEELVAKSQAGDGVALDELLARAQPDLRRFAERLCRTRDDADEAVQTVLVHLSLRVEGLRSIQRFTSWAFAAIKNECLRAVRRATRWQPQGDDPLDPITPLEHLEGEALRRRLIDAVRGLPAPLLEVFVLRELEELDTAACAQRLGLSEANVKVRLHRARTHVKAALGLS